MGTEWEQCGNRVGSDDSSRGIMGTELIPCLRSRYRSTKKTRIEFFMVPCYLNIKTFVFIISRSLASAVLTKVPKNCALSVLLKKIE